MDPRELRTLAIGLLARSDELAGETENNQQKVSKFLRECLLLGRERSETSERTLREIGIKEGGAAFERANHLTSALQYYGQWLGGSPLQATRDEQKIAHIRWLICKRRLASWHKEKGKQSRQPELAAQHSTDALNLETEARNKAAEWGVSAEGASQYPELEARLASIALPPIEPDQRTAPSDRVDRDDLDLDVGGRQLHVHVLRRRHRVVLTDGITQEQVTLDHGEPWSDDLDVRQLEAEGLQRRWEVPSWGIVIELETNTKGAMVRIRNTTTGSEQFSMPIPN